MTPQEAGAIRSMYTPKDVAVMAKVCRKTILRDTRAGKIHCRRFGPQRIRYTQTAVDEYLEGKRGK